MADKAGLAQALEAFQRGDLERALDLAEVHISASSSADWHHLAGLVHCRRGDPARGVDHLRVAAEAAPTNLGYRVMFARALIDSGRAAEVLAMDRPPPIRGPAELALWQVRAEAAGAVGNNDAAAESWAVVAMHGKPNPEAWTNLARCQFALKRFEAAESACGRALALSSGNVGAFLTLGLIYERTNRIEELDRLLDTALRRGIGKPQLAYLWALREQRAGNLESARLLLQQADPAEDPVRWHRLRIKIADKEGDCSTAFESMIAMNRATVHFDGWRRRGAAFRQDLRGLEAVMTPEWARRIPRVDPPTTLPVFLLGLPRSGTTLLDTFLMGHPSICVVEEKEILRRAGQIVGPLAKLDGISQAALERAQRAYLDELGTYVDPGFDGSVIDKNPFNMLLAPLIDVFFGGAPIVFAKRHPCDAVLSGFMQSYIPNIGMASFLDLGDAAALYDATMRIWAASTELFALNVHTVAYEDLIADPERELRGVTEFLGLGWDDRVLDHRATARARGALTNTSYDQITEPLTGSAVGRWRGYRKQLEAVLPVLLPWTEWLGYRD